MRCVACLTLHAAALAPSDPEASISQLKDTVIPTVEGHVTEIIAVVQTTTTTIVGLVEGGLASKAALTEAQLSTLLADIEALKATIADIKSMAESDFAKFLCGQCNSVLIFTMALTRNRNREPLEGRTRLPLRPALPAP
jgi:hypothetical protein